MFEYRNIIEPFLANAQAYPERLAVVYKSAQLTYRDLDEYSSRLALTFHDNGVKTGDKVAYLFPNCIEVIAVYLAIQRMGAVAVPLNYRIIPREIAYLTNSVDARMLVFDEQFEDRVQESKPQLHKGIRLFSLTRTTDSLQYHSDSEVMTKSPEVPLYLGGGLSRIQFTGGSTGIPKGACRTHAADLVEMHAVMASNGMLEMDHPIALIQCPLEHHGGHSWFVSSLSAGATVVVCGKFNPHDVFEQIEYFQVSHMILLPPTTYLRLVREGNPDSREMMSVRIVQSSAGGMTPEIAQAIFDTFPNANINYGWGQSESGVGTSMRITRDMLTHREPKIYSVGTPMETLKIRIVDDDGNDVEEGQSGEAIVQSPAMMEGYYQQPKLTKEAFLNGWLRTGDIMSRDCDGYYYLKSRKKDMIKSGGENVFINEVQTAILRNPLVADCVVFGVPDPVLGEAVAAVVQPVSGSSLTERDIQETCKSYIASYKKPRYIVFTNDIGRDDAGKVRLSNVIKYFNSKRNDVAGK